MKVTERDSEAVSAFSNFLSWGQRPAMPSQPAPVRTVPPAWFAYAWGLTTWCPPKGEL